MNRRLILSRRVNERVIIDGNIRIEVLSVQGQKCRLGVVAPESVRVLREEVIERKDKP